MPSHDPPHRGQTDAGAFKLLGQVKPLEDAEELVGILHISELSLCLGVFSVANFPHALAARRTFTTVLLALRTLHTFALLFVEIDVRRMSMAPARRCGRRP